MIKEHLVMWVISQVRLMMGAPSLNYIKTIMTEQYKLFASTAYLLDALYEFGALTHKQASIIAYCKEIEG